MAEPFYYLSAEDVVPRDAVYVIIGGSVTVVPPLAFDGYHNLRRVELQEGVQEIGRRAFFRCPSLERVDCPSSLRTIGEEAFAECLRLLELILRDGLQIIGRSMFLGCDLRRITVPSSVVEIGAGAFAGCRRLSEVILQEGLQRIGMMAFLSCSLERITVPSSVVEIGDGAFGGCPNLEAATLAGGMVLVARRAFLNCPQLERISISSISIVVQVGEDGNGRVAAVTGGIEWHPAEESPRLILSSPHLVSMRPEELSNLTDAIDRIAGRMRRQGAGPLDLDGEVSGRIRDGSVDHLSTWYRRYKREAATILELALWKIELDRSRGAFQDRAAGGGKRARADVPTRDDCRRTCGAVPIVGLVLSSLAGPHRRVDQGENAGPIQP